MRSRGRSTPRRRGLATNTVAQAAPMLTSYLASFVSAPIVLSSLGLKAFGIWALTGALAGYAALLDFGVGPVLVRFIALHTARGEEERIPEVIGTGCLTSALMTATLLAASFLAATPLASAMHVGAGEMRVLLLCSTVMFGVSLLVNVLTAYAIGMQEMVGPNLATTVGALLNFGFSVASVLSSHSLVRYAEANAMASVLTLALVVVVAHGSMHGRTSIRMPRWVTAREILTFSVKSQALTAANLINEQTDKIIIAFCVGPAAAGAYELANRVAVAGRSIGVLSVGAMMPTMTAAGVEASREELSRTYLRWTTLSSALGTPILLLMAFMPILVLHAWLGQVPSHSAVVLCGLCLSYVLLGTTAVGYVLAQATGRPELPAKVWIWTSVVNLALTAALAPFFGVVGVLIGTALACSVGSLAQVWLVHRAFGLPFSRYVEAVRPCLVLGVVTAAPLLAVNFAAADLSRGLQAGLVVLSGTAFCIVYTLAANRLGLLPPALARRLPLAPRVGLTPAVQS